MLAYIQTFAKNFLRGIVKSEKLKKLAKSIYMLEGIPKEIVKTKNQKLKKTRQVDLPVGGEFPKIAKKRKTQKTHQVDLHVERNSQENRQAGNPKLKTQKTDHPVEMNFLNEIGKRKSR